MDLGLQSINEQFSCGNFLKVRTKMQSDNLNVYASQTGFQSELVGKLTAERYQELRTSVWLDWRLYFGVVAAAIAGVYSILNAALNRTPSAMFAIVVTLAVFNAESGLSKAVSEAIKKNPTELVEGFVTLVKYSFGLALLFVFLRDVFVAFLSGSSPSDTYDDAVRKAVAKELGLNNMRVDLVSEPIQN